MGRGGVFVRQESRRINITIFGEKTVPSYKKLMKEVLDNQGLPKSCYRIKEMLVAPSQNSVLTVHYITFKKSVPYEVIDRILSTYREVFRGKIL